MKSKKIAATLAAVLVSGAVTMTVPAINLDWNDLTDSQQEQAYKQLESENEALRQQLAQLQGQTGASGSGTTSSGDGTAAGTADSNASGDGSTGSAADSSGGSTSGGSTSASGDVAAGAAQAQSSQVKSVDTFLQDLAASFNGRQEMARTYTNEQVSAMSESEMWDFRFSCAEAERNFYDTYNGAQFDDLNVYYLCSEYCMGLGKQFQAKDVWYSSGDSDEANRLYTAGYYNRAYALVELCEYYGLNLADEYQNLKNAVTQMDNLSGEETRNASVESAKVQQVQELLNSLGFLCGTPDGIAGRQTASCIERFQNMYGYDPADGIIDDELITQLQEQLSKRQG